MGVPIPIPTPIPTCAPMGRAGFGLVSVARLASSLLMEVGFSTLRTAWYVDVWFGSAAQKKPVIV